jgi:hypothetical protein
MKRMVSPVLYACVFALGMLLAASQAGRAAGSYQTRPAFQEQPQPQKPVASSVQTVPAPKLNPSVDLAGCGRGRVRDPQTHQCRGPGDVSR